MLVAISFFPFSPPRSRRQETLSAADPMSRVLRRSGNLVLDARTAAGERGTVCRRNSGRDGVLETSVLRGARFLTPAIGLMAIGERVRARRA